MPTAACGINCDVCRLYTLGICTSCGAGTSEEARRKIEAQTNRFGQPCPRLACARTNGLSYCMRDCDTFPCENYSASDYPFSRRYLAMQERRRKEAAKKQEETSAASGVRVPEEYWDCLAARDLRQMCATALAVPTPDGNIRLGYLRTEILVDLKKRCIRKHDGQSWQRADDPLLELLCLVYLRDVTSAPFRQQMAGVNDLKDGQFFQGPHELGTAPLIDRFGRDPALFSRVAETLGGRPTGQADAGYVFSPFPRVLLYYLLWEGDDEFAPSLSILFDRSIEDHFSADFTWGLVNHVSGVLLSKR